MSWTRTGYPLLAVSVAFGLWSADALAATPAFEQPRSSTGHTTQTPAFHLGQGNTSEVKVAACYPQVQDINKQKFIHCVNRANPELADCRAPAQCVIYINGTPQTHGEHEYNPTDTYSCKCE